MNKSIIFRILLVLILISGLWLVWWIFGRSPEAQVRAAQANLIQAVEKRDWKGLARLLAPNYTDAYGHNRDTAIQEGRKYFSTFFTLTLKTDQTTIRATQGQGMVTTKIRLEGNGVGYSPMISGYVNQITEPWVFHWSNPGRWPWNWQVNLIHNDQVSGANFQGTP
jgi:predicted lipid-binding transport protein (Tim44 family)